MRVREEQRMNKNEEEVVVVVGKAESDEERGGGTKELEAEHPTLCKSSPKPRTGTSRRTSSNRIRRRRRRRRGPFLKSLHLIREQFLSRVDDLTHRVMICWRRRRVWIRMRIPITVAFDLLLWTVRRCLYIPLLGPWSYPCAWS